MLRSCSVKRQVVKADGTLFTMNADMKPNTRIFRAIEESGHSKDFEVHITPQEIIQLIVVIGSSNFA